MTIPLRVLTLAAAASGLLAPPGLVAAAPVLRAAEGRIHFTSPVTCAVELTVTVEGAASIEHRLELPPGAAVTRLEVDGATAEAPHDIGRTRALTVTPPPAAPPYTLRYEVRQADARPYRCPLWLPTVPADGRSRAVHLAAEVPDGSTVTGGMPTFTWQASRGEVRLPHLPAFVIVPFVAAGEAPRWDVSRVMDAVAIATIAAATLVWLARRRTRG